MEPTEPTIEQLISGIRELRKTMPDFNPNEEDSKGKIEEAHLSIHHLVMRVQSEVGFDTYEQTLKFIDQEIENVSRIEVAS